MSRAIGYVKFEDGEIKRFLYSGTGDFCYSKLYEQDENFDWDECETNEWDNVINICKHKLEEVEIFTTYGGGFYWKGKACRECMNIIKNLYPFELDLEEIQDGYPKWIQFKYKYNEYDKQFFV
jgi:hypothetical protein